MRGTLPERVQCRGEKNNTLLTAGHAPPVIALATRRKRRLEKEKIVHEQLVACATPLAATRMDMHFIAKVVIFVAALGCDFCSKRGQRRLEKENTLSTGGHAPPVSARPTRGQRRLEKENTVRVAALGCDVCCCPELCFLLLPWVVIFVVASCCDFCCCPGL